MRARFSSMQAANRGSRLHAWAHEAINLGQRMKENSTTMNKYINEGIRYRMLTDFVLFFSENAFGEADTLVFRDNILRIHDLKTGLHPAKMEQLEVYAALFCLEYSIEPEDITIVLRIYQSDQIIGGNANPATIRDHMNQIKQKDAWLRKFKREVE